MKKSCSLSHLPLICNSLEIFCNSHPEIYIYGAGVCGKNLAVYFAYRGWDYRGFIVTDNKKKEEHVLLNRLKHTCKAYVSNQYALLFHYRNFTVFYQFIRHAVIGIFISFWKNAIYTNDSFFGFFYPLEDAFALMDESACDFWGMTGQGAGEYTNPLHSLQTTYTFVQHLFNDLSALPIYSYILFSLL